MSASLVVYSLALLFGASLTTAVYARISIIPIPNLSASTPSSEPEPIYTQLVAQTTPAKIVTTLVAAEAKIPPPARFPTITVAQNAPVRIEPKIDFSYTCARPEYNEQARRAEAQGSTTILFTMDTTGHISEATVVKSSGESREHKMLDRLALEAVRNCKGTPGTLDGVPQRITSRITYVWRISGTQSAYWPWVPVPYNGLREIDESSLVYRHPKVKYRLRVNDPSAALYRAPPQEYLVEIDCQQKLRREIVWHKDAEPSGNFTGVDGFSSVGPRQELEYVCELARQRQNAAIPPAATGVVRPESSAVAPVPAAAPSVAPGRTSPRDEAARLEKLNELRSKGLISESEYQQKRSQILDSL